jgi:hypothetical protein
MIKKRKVTKNEMKGLSTFDSDTVFLISGSGPRRYLLTRFKEHLVLALIPASLIVKTLKISLAVLTLESSVLMWNPVTKKSNEISSANLTRINEKIDNKIDHSYIQASTGLQGEKVYRLEDVQRYNLQADYFYYLVKYGKKYGVEKLIEVISN